MASDYANNIKYKQKPKIQQKSARRKCRSHLNYKIFSEKFNYDPLKIFSMPKNQYWDNGSGFEKKPKLQ